MLEMRDVTFHYTDGTPVLEHMNLTVGTGEFIGLGGRNGCGKTTVTRLLMGLENPYREIFSSMGKESTMKKRQPAVPISDMYSSGRNGRCSDRLCGRK